ncbi:hypothetical protein HHK36_014709 [Tetracentron sinense]|uniref:glutamate decarboxylase n=1 Tax=Tetracentron sinense TaxID=13715 RepID=A0A834Z3D3_TETSI|nr:hypothetical protein HHK36_014709 [Tetracentron sinense]
MHCGSRLLEFTGYKVANKTLDWLTSKKGEVILKKSVNLNSVTNEEKTYQTSGGETIRADCQFMCTGKPLVSSWLKETVLKHSLDVPGRLMVDENLRVKGRKNVFAIGNITNILEIEQGYLAQKHVEVTAKNLKLSRRGGKENKMATYKPANYFYRLTELKGGRYRMPERSIPKEAAYQIIHDELLLDGNPRLNLASFVTTWMEPECDRLMVETMNKNYVDMDEYPVTTEIQVRILIL